ncbi:Na(+)/H(+) antiporter subunit C [Ornithinimicrobium pratense]|uniref:Na(+)/H(+) antiporter subunit C n=1 Tax=Ornithinimicrobium pratense TaxID=2593973 RepID=UPI001787E839|nr:Na(+)/H(+) antiporter subunit C [Ornithinimicrobium pratense]
MTPNLSLIVVASVLIGTGVYLFLARSLVRALMGFLLMGNGINLLYIIGSGPAGAPPIVGVSEDTAMADPVPQALVLTAIVITLAMTAFVLALAHRSWQLGREDLVVDDLESARIHAMAEAVEIDGPSARERADEIAAETQRTERKMHETTRQGIPGDPATPTTERYDHAMGGPGQGTVDPEDVAEERLADGGATVDASGRTAGESTDGAERGLDLSPGRDDSSGDAQGSDPEGGKR